MNKTYFEKYISSFIASQLPGFRSEDGPNLVAFIKTYYEWLERTDKFTITFNPTFGADFVIGSNIINLNDTGEQSIVVSTGDNTIDVLGSSGMKPGCWFSQINKIDRNTGGTLTFTKDSRVVTGIGTSFLSKFAVGEYIYANENIHKVTSIMDDFRLIVEKSASQTLSNIPYVRYLLSPPIRVVDVQNNPNVIAAIRRFADDSDIDSTLPQFVKYFKSKYMNSMPNEMLTDKRFLTKHILDLYRTKGTERSYELLFRILFNEDVSIFLPSQHLFSTSEAEWTVPTYIEVSDTDKLHLFINQEIYSSSKNASAVVEYAFKKNIDGRIVCGLLISNIQGIFHFGDYILCKQLPEITKLNAPRITGSLSAITITNGGSDFKIGDELDIAGSGIGGKALVTSVVNESGKTDFFLKSGGSGYSMNASIIIDSTNTGGSGASFQIGDLTNKEIIQVSTDPISFYYNTQLDNSANTFTVSLSNTSGSFIAGELVKSNVTVVPLDVTLVSGTPQIGETVSNGSISAKLSLFDVNFAETIANTGAFTGGLTLTGANSGSVFTINTVFASKVVECNAYVLSVAGANLTLKNCFSFSATNSVVLSTIVSNSGVGYANGDVVSFTGGGGNGAIAIITTDGNGGVVTADIQDNGASYGSTPSVSIATANGSGAVITPVVEFLAGYPYPGSTLIGQTSGASGKISDTDRLTNWNFPALTIPDIENLDSQISAVLSFQTIEIGTIRYITAVNPGDGYVLPPKVTIIEPEIALLEIDDGLGNVKGNNAIVTSTAGDANGVVTSVKMLSSGFGYQPQETLYLTNPLNNKAITGDSVIDQHGKYAGYWKNRKSFPSDTMYIQDSYYWQRFSYDIQAARMIDTYRPYVKELIHPSGLAMFGTFKKNDYKDSSSSLMESSLIQS